MHRRSFLYHAGYLVPAIILSPSLVWASKKTIDADVLVIQDATATANFVFNTMHLSIYSHEIRRLIYTDNGFLVTTEDNSIFLAQKIIVQANFTITPERSSIKINGGNNMLDIALDRPNNRGKATPEFWFIQPETFDMDRANSFIQRNRHALLCLTPPPSPAPLPSPPASSPISP